MTRSVLVYLAVIAGIVAFSGLFVLIFGNSIEVQCIREIGRDPGCKITSRLLGQIPMLSRDVPGVIGVQLDESCDDGCSYRAMLLTSTGRAFQSMRSTLTAALSCAKWTRWRHSSAEADGPSNTRSQCRGGWLA